MENYLKPDGWVILKIKSTGTGYDYKLFSSWRGGYLGNDTWRLNSGISSIEKENDYYVVRGYSETVYIICPSTFGRLGVYNEYVLKTIIGDNDVQIISLEEYLK